MLSSQVAWLSHHKETPLPPSVSLSLSLMASVLVRV